MYVVDAPTVSSNCRSDCHITFEICLIECSLYEINERAVKIPSGRTPLYRSVYFVLDYSISDTRTVSMIYPVQKIYLLSINGRSVNNGCRSSLIVPCTHSVF